MQKRPCLLLAINTSWNILNFRAGLIKALLARDYEVIAVAPLDDYSVRVAQLGIRYMPLPMEQQGTSPWKDLVLAGRFLRLLRRERPDVYLGYTVKPNVYGSLAAHVLRIPVINNIAGLGTAFIRNTLLTRMVKALYRVALRRSHTVFFQNDDDRVLFISERLVQPEKTSLLPGSGIDLLAFQPSNLLPHDDTLRFLLVARLLWDKGVGEFVEAARIVRQKAPRTRFQLLGFLDVENPTAVDRALVDHWVSEGVIDYLGATDDVRPFIAASDCIVLPSYREGTPRSLLEGAAMGKPLIATDVPGCRQVVEHGENGFLCAPRDKHELASRMLEFTELSPERRLAMGAASRAKVEREFDERIVIERYLYALDTIFDGKGAAGALT